MSKFWVYVVSYIPQRVVNPPDDHIDVEESTHIVFTYQLYVVLEVRFDKEYEFVFTVSTVPFPCVNPLVPHSTIHLDAFEFCDQLKVAELEVIFDAVNPAGDGHPDACVNLRLSM